MKHIKKTIIFLSILLIIIIVVLIVILVINKKEESIYENIGEDIHAYETDLYEKMLKQRLFYSRR